ncbi:MAG: lipocalin family protein [Bacteroidota bacterium]|nr:lipocalin family protein [Bacteroidota bacterium]
MKKILFVVLSVFIFSSCEKGKQESSAPNTTTKTESKQNTPPPVEKTAITPNSVLGSWVSNDEYKMGFELMNGGKAASINMATLDYNSWTLAGDKLTLNSTSKGVSNPVTVDEVYIVREISPVNMIVSRSDNPDTKLTYNKK